MHEMLQNQRVGPPHLLAQALSAARRIRRPRPAGSLLDTVAGLISAAFVRSCPWTPPRVARKLTTEQESRHSP